jgi:hypothetical protein
MNQKYSTTLFLQMNEIVNQPAKKNNFHLSFVTILVSIVAGSHTAIAQTVSADQNEHRPLDQLLVAHRNISTQGSGSSKNYHLHNRFIAGGERRDGDGESRDRDDKRREGGHHHGEHHKDGHNEDGKKPEKSPPQTNPTVQRIPNPVIEGGGSGSKPQVLIIPNPHMEGGGSGSKPSKPEKPRHTRD